LAFLFVQALSLRIINPLYEYPAGSGLSDYKTCANAGVDQTLIINPTNGDANSCPPNSDWAAAIQTLLAGNPPVKIIGYVHSSYGKRNQTQITPEIDNYFNCWNVSGIFIDEADNTAANVNYYGQLYTYIKGKRAPNQVWLNPGTNVVEQYMNVSDTVCIYESPYSQWASWTPASYVKNYKNTKFCALSLTTPSASAQDSFFAQAANYNIDFVGATGPGQNNWNNLNSLWSDEVAYIKAHPGQMSGIRSDYFGSHIFGKIPFFCDSFNPCYDLMLNLAKMGVIFEACKR